MGLISAFYIECNDCQFQTHDFGTKELLLEHARCEGWIKDGKSNNWLCPDCVRGGIEDNAVEIGRLLGA